MITTFVKDVSDRFKGEAHVYRCEPPVRYFDNDDKLRESEYVVASAVDLDWGSSTCETLIFPSTEDGLVESWRELPGSISGTRSISRAIAGLEDEPVPAYLEDEEGPWSWIDEGE